MNETPKLHFSKKILLLSLIFLLANLGIYALRSIAPSSAELEQVSPGLKGARISEISVKGPHDSDYREGMSGEAIFTGTLIKTEKGEFAQLNLGKNNLRLDEKTIIEFTENNHSAGSESPRLVFSLEQGSVWVSADDSIRIETPQSAAVLRHGAAIVTRQDPLHRLMVISGDADLILRDDSGSQVADFVVPLHNQVTFVAPQITEVYAALKPSKLRKELKMSPLPTEILEDEWVKSNVADFMETKEEFNSKLISSGLAYNIRAGAQKMGSFVTFIPEARRNLEVSRIETKLHYLLGGVDENRDIAKAKKIIAKLGVSLKERQGDPKVEALITETLYAIQKANFGTPAYLLRDELMNQALDSEGAFVYRLYLSDLRRLLLEKKSQQAGSVLGKWREAWTEARIKGNLDEFGRQTQILNHTLLSFIGEIPLEFLEPFDWAGQMRMIHENDKEEARFEVTQDSLQIAASLVSNYRYALAKQYLKTSYESLNIEKESPDLPSTRIFLENGKLLLQRIKYAEDVLRGAAQPIDETQFRDYVQNRLRDELLAGDLKVFFEQEEEKRIEVPALKAPSTSEVALLFAKARVTVSENDIELISGAGFSYAVKNARLMDKGPEGQTLSFEGNYELKSNSISQVVAEGRSYAGSFILEDLVLVLKRGGTLGTLTRAPQIDEEGIGLLITDEEKVIAEEGQLVAQDVARQLAYNELLEVGIRIPDPKFDIEIIDALNLNKFRILRGLVDREGDAVTISFIYSSQEAIASDIKSEAGVLLLDKSPVAELAGAVRQKIAEIEKELAAIESFTVFVKQNNLSIDPQNISYNQDETLQFKELEMPVFGLRVSGAFDPTVRKFVNVSHAIYSASDIDFREYFEGLAERHLSAHFGQQGLSVQNSQLVIIYPFRSIAVEGMSLEGIRFSFNYDYASEVLSNVKRQGSDEVIAQSSISELKSLAAKLRAAAEANAIEAADTEEES
ncbi:MAG: hypothetical protein OEY44_04020 [Candidatus Peregrinibacteria bacterium]|nr:hypothetical protein [Candidatus Peregrinibacteria bacterium]